MIIYLNKEDMRSYALTKDVTWETIELEVPDDFVGGGKYYDLKSKKWIDDKPSNTNEDYFQILQRKHDLMTQRNYHYEEMQICNALDEKEKARQHAIKIREIDVELGEIKNG